MTQQTKPTHAGEAARAALRAAETEHAAKLGGERDARAQLEVATQALRDEGTAGARKALINAEQAMRFAEIEASGSSQRFERARARLEQADHADRLAAHSRCAGRVSFMSFAAASNPIACKLAELRARVAEAEAEAAVVCRGFIQEAKGIAEEGRELGASGIRALDYVRVLDSLTARAAARGRVEDVSPAVRILSEVWAMQPVPGMAPEDALAAIERGVDPREVARLIADLGRATLAQGVAARKLVTLGHLPPNPNADRGTVPLVQFESCSTSAERTRATLQGMGFGAGANNVHADALVSRLLAVPAFGNVSGAQRVGELVTQLRNVDFASVPGAMNQHQTAAGRERLAADLVVQFDALGLADIAASVRPNRPVPPGVALPGGMPGFVNLGA